MLSIVHLDPLFLLSDLETDLAVDLTDSAVDSIRSAVDSEADLEMPICALQRMVLHLLTMVSIPLITLPLSMELAERQVQEERV